MSRRCGAPFRRLGNSRLLEHAAIAFEMAAISDEPHRRPKRRLRARHDRNAVPLFERLGHAERAQAPAGDQQAFRPRRLGTDLVAERDDILLALVARIAEAEETESLERQHLEAVRVKKAS